MFLPHSRRTYLQHVEAVRVTEVPTADLSAHVPAVEWSPCKLETTTVEEHVGDSGQYIPAQVQLLKPLKPVFR